MKQVFKSPKLNCDGLTKRDGTIGPGLTSTSSTDSDNRANTTLVSNLAVLGAKGVFPHIDNVYMTRTRRYDLYVQGGASDNEWERSTNVGAIL